MAEFGTAGIRGHVAEELPPETVTEIGRAIAEEGENVVIGRDGRTTGPGLMDAAVAGLTSGGARVERLGVVPTPALAFASQGRIGVMITASHNPPADNGLKVFLDGVEIGRAGEERIEQRVRAGTTPISWDRWGTQRNGRVLAAYRAAVTAYLREQGPSADGLSVAIDCGSGVGGLATPDILGDLGADVRTLNGHVDGHFPARASKPTPETLGIVSGFVNDGPFDLGLALDGDADRLVVLDRDGEVVHEDTILAIIATHYVQRSTSEDPVVLTTPNASTRVDDRVAEFGGRVERTALGTLHEGIARIREEAETVETRLVFAGEPWKHIHPAFGGWIDGIVGAGLITTLLAEAGDMNVLREPIREPPYRKRSIRCPNQKKQAILAALETELPDRFPDAEVDTRYGLRLNFPEGGWFLVRPSGTEPMFRLYVEHPDVDELVQAVDSHIRECVSRQT